MSLVYFSHVQVSNKDAITFYEKFGFHTVELKENYYKRIEPADAYVVQKDLKEDKSTESSSCSQTNSATLSTGNDGTTDNNPVNIIVWNSRH